MVTPFWNHLDQLLQEHELVIDRPKGSIHPRFPSFPYPLDYGFLQSTSSGDGQGIDVWVGSLPGRQLVGLLCTVDLEKRDAEIKLLVGCAKEEMQTLLAAHNCGLQSAILLERP